MSATTAVGPIMFKNVLFVTDFSSSSEMALPYAIALAGEYGGKVYLGHVITPQLYDLVPPDFVPEVLRQSMAYAQRRMERLVKETDFRAVPHEVLLEQGELWETLRCMAVQYSIDVTALGAGGRPGLHELLMGAVAEEILRLATVPVLTVGPQSVEVPPETEPRCILFANDFSVNCFRAMFCANSLAEKFSARLVSLHVAGEVPEDPEASTRVEQFFVQKLEQCVGVTAGQKGHLDFQVGFGMPADSILKAAAQYGADLIVMGVRGAGTVVRPSCHLGRTAYRVVLEARCPVLTVAS